MDGWMDVGVLVGCQLPMAGRTPHPSLGSSPPVHLPACLPACLPAGPFLSVLLPSYGSVCGGMTVLIRNPT